MFLHCKILCSAVVQMASLDAATAHLRSADDPSVFTVLPQGQHTGLAAAAAQHFHELALGRAGLPTAKRPAAPPAAQQTLSGAQLRHLQQLYSAAGVDFSGIAAVYANLQGLQLEGPPPAVTPLPATLTSLLISGSEATYDSQEELWLLMQEGAAGAALIRLRAAALRAA